MSKRCCAASCYNSVATNRSVEYFGFPKSFEYASAWARAAGREDLLEKSINNIIKYFLCSEHFSEDCFQDPPLNRKLKKTSRPVVVPIPTIFQNNFDECVSKSLKEERLYSQLVNSDEKNPHSTQIKEGLGENVIIERLNDSDSVNSQADASILQITSEDDFIIIADDHQELNAEAVTEVVRYEEKVVEEHIMAIADSIPQDDNTYTEVIVGSINCRLCLSTNENELLIPIFDDGSEIAYILDKILPDSIKPNDGLPQEICLVCLESATRCLNTIEKFKAVQDKLKGVQ